MTNSVFFWLALFLVPSAVWFLLQQRAKRRAATDNLVGVNQRGGAVFVLNRKPKDLVALKIELTKLAEQLARETFGITLDYSVASVQQVESILGEIHDGFKQTENEEGLRGVALEFAAYLISVIERNFGKGTWNRDDPSMGAETFPYEWSGVVLFPYGWCLKRILDGPQDDVWAKFQAIVMWRGAAG